LIPDPKYPIGRYELKDYAENQKQNWLDDIKFLPVQLENSIQNLDAAQLHSPYRSGSWTIHQLVHHVADSHMNAYIRFKLGMTEDNVTVKTYEEKLWAELADVRTLPVNVSITLLHALHARWYEAIKNLTDAQWHRTLRYPDNSPPVTIWYLLGNYAWHGRHHVAQILSYRKTNNL
jgi:hypothetical protein